MSEPTLQHFNTFLAVAENRGITAAARHLGISKAAVSHTIRLLEESLQVPLFIRDTRNISLTEEGELLVLQCRRIKEELELTKNLITGFHETPTGILRISCNPYFAETHLVHTLQKYLQKFPKVNVEVITEERMPNLEREKIDIVFGINWPAPLDVVAKVFGKTRYVLCASPKYFANFGKPKKLKDLEKHHYISHIGRTSENSVVDLKDKVTLKLTPYLKLNSALLMKQCALKGLGIIQLHEYMVETELKKGTLQEVLNDYLNPEVCIYVYYQKHRFVQPKIRQFINLLMT